MYEDNDCRWYPIRHRDDWVEGNKRLWDLTGKEYLDMSEAEVDDVMVDFILLGYEG